MSKFLRFASRHGAIRLGECVICRSFLTALRFLYGFDPWHARAPYACRPYKQLAVELASTGTPRLVVEIGCGLGAIISRVSAQRRLGLDLEPRALAAARFLNGDRAEFGLASLFDSDAVANEVGDGSIDVLIIVNWANALSVERLQEELDALRARVPVQRLLIDEVPLEPGCFRHSTEALQPLGRPVASRYDPVDNRGLHLLELHPARRDRGVNQAAPAT